MSFINRGGERGILLYYLWEQFLTNQLTFFSGFPVNKAEAHQAKQENTRYGAQDSSYYWNDVTFSRRPSDNGRTWDESKTKWTSQQKKKIRTN